MSKIFSYPKKFLSVIDNNFGNFGIEFLKVSLVMATVYAVQGMQSLAAIPQLFWFKNVLKFDEVQLQYFAAVTSFAWLMKPLFGYISDRFPILGYRRKPYMVLMAIVAATSWWLAALMAHYGYTKWIALIAVFNFSSLGYAFVDVVCDAIMVEKGQAMNKEKFFVCLQWTALGFAAFIAGALSGHLQNAIENGTMTISTVFIFTGIIPLITAIISWFCISEEKINKLINKKVLPSAEAKIIDDIMHGGKIKPEEKTPEDNQEQCTEKLSSNSELFKEILTSKIFWILTFFIFFWKFSPSFSGVFSYYSIDSLKFDEIFLGNNSAIANAVFPIAIFFYMGLSKWFRKIKDKHYLYASVMVGIIYYAVDWLYFMPESKFNHISINLPFGNFGCIKWLSVLSLWIILLHIADKLIHKYIIRKKSDKPPVNFEPDDDSEQNDNFENYDSRYSNFAAESYFEKKSLSVQKTKFVLKWLIILPVSLFASLKFAGIAYAPLTLSYQSIYVLNNVIFSYATIASFLIPLSLAAELAPKKAEGMTYAYFMALSNISGSFLSSLSGGWMFKILKSTITQPQSVITALPIKQIVFILWIPIVIAIAYTIGKKMFQSEKLAINLLSAIFIQISTIILLPITVIYYLPYLNNVMTYAVQQSYFFLAPIVGNADWAGKEFCRVLILRYSVIIGIIFVIISTIFVWLLPDKKDKK